MKHNKKSIDNVLSLLGYHRDYSLFLKKFYASPGKGLDKFSNNVTQYRLKLLCEIKAILDIPDNYDLFLIPLSKLDFNLFNNKNIVFTDILELVDQENHLKNNELGKLLLQHKTLAISFETVWFMAQGISLCIASKQTIDRLTPFLYGGGMVGELKDQHFSIKTNTLEKFWVGTFPIGQLILLAKYLKQLKPKK